LEKRLPVRLSSSSVSDEEERRWIEMVHGDRLDGVVYGLNG